MYGIKDDSFALVGRADVVYEPPAELEDEVSFAYGSRRSLHRGIIKAFGDDHDAMKRVMNRLNKDRSKHTTSFDADMPRRAKVIGRDQISKLSSKSVNKSAVQPSGCDPSPPLGSSANSEESEASDASECDLTDKDDSESSEDSDMALQDLVKKSRKKRALDVKAIRLGKENESPNRSWKSIRHCSRTSITGTAQPVKTPLRAVLHSSPTPPSPPRTTAAPKARRDVMISSNNGNSSSNSNSSDTFGNGEHEDGSRESTRRDVMVSGNNGNSNNSIRDSGHEGGSEESTEAMQRKRKRARRARYTKAVFSGEYFRYREASEDVLPLREGGSIFVHKRAMKLAKKAKTPTSVARQLVKSVFSDKALLECSVTGRPSTSTRTGERVIRPPLDADGVCEILDFVEHRCLKKGWGKMEETPVKRAMMDVMNEDRYFLYLQQNEQQQQQG
ncbi:Putative BEN domain-containing protein B1 [Frankliniella fusca]|uniref:BEN domain-containing protein B1 n=1 Tax=Frankliniella fusca TaxID=407009 RepID=A0AAE1LEN6_9NEOP|nr:Putative BEN domain-containing protein B1 [Frankliniella fusca]KAK3923181.1 Putative BEN domain-containing protein B1 [Frankliniella fusca]